MYNLKKGDKVVCKNKIYWFYDQVGVVVNVCYDWQTVENEYTVQFRDQTVKLYDNDIVPYETQMIEQIEQHKKEKFNNNRKKINEDEYNQKSRKMYYAMVVMLLMTIVTLTISIIAMIRVIYFVFTM